MATDLLAPHDASRCVIIGAGGQAADQARAMYAVRPLERLTIVSRTQQRAQALADQLSGELADVAVTASAYVEEAVRGADLICCATTATEPLFGLNGLRPNVHINAIGSFRPALSGSQT